MVDATIEFASPTYNRELVQKAGTLSGIEVSPVSEPTTDDSKAGFGAIAGAILKITAESAVVPMIDLIRYFFQRDRTSAKAHIKLASGDEFDLDFSNLDVELNRLESVLLKLIRTSKG